MCQYERLRGQAYNDSSSADQLADHGSRVAFTCPALSDVVHCLCHDDDAFAENNEREESDALIQIRPLEAHFTPLARASEDDECFHSSQDIPD